MRTGNATHFSTFSQRFKPSLKFPSKLINIPSRKSCSFQYILSHPEHTSQTLISSMTWVSMTPVLRETLNNKLLFPLWHASNHTEDKNLSSNRVTHDHVPKNTHLTKSCLFFSFIILGNQTQEFVHTRLVFYRWAASPVLVMRKEKGRWDLMNKGGTGGPERYTSPSHLPLSRLLKNYYQTMPMEDRGLSSSRGWSSRYRWCTQCRCCALRSSSRAIWFLTTEPFL